MKKILKVLTVILAVILLWGITHQIMTSVEKSKYTAIGQLVNVDGRNIHIYTQGEGEKVIVLMSGLGTTAPALDFEPLMNELSPYYKVVVVEPFGYGWSDHTEKERSVENMVNEMRTAMFLANIDGPYTLMPHSVSGIYALYYASMYPDEVEAIVGIDCTLPIQSAYFGEALPKGVPQFAWVTNSVGISRLMAYLSPKSFVSENNSGIYSDWNIAMQKRISAWNNYNKTIIAETNMLSKNIEITLALTIPKELPALFFIREPKQIREDGKTKACFYETYITNSTCQKIVVLEGKHYLHWTRSHEIAQGLRDFFTSYNSKNTKGIQND